MVAVMIVGNTKTINATTSVTDDFSVTERASALDVIRLNVVVFFMFDTSSCLCLP